MSGVTKALRKTFGKGTIPCSVCELPAAGIFDGTPLCSYHARAKYGFLPGV